jgi:hypothetical protein
MKVKAFMAAFRGKSRMTGRERSKSAIEAIFSFQINMRGTYAKVSSQVVDGPALFGRRGGLADISRSAQASQ